MPCWTLLISASSAVRCSSCGCLLRQRGLEAVLLADVCHRLRRLAREPRDEIALFALEPAELTLDIEIQIAESPVGGQRSNQAGALVCRRSAFRPVPQTRPQRAPRLREPGRDRLQQFSLGLPLRQLRAGRLEAAWCIQHQQHSPCGAECAHFINQQPMQFGETAGAVQALAVAASRSTDSCGAETSRTACVESDAREQLERPERHFRALGRLPWVLF